jgi:tetratricopeptide (TPR) repeat protein
MSKKSSPAALSAAADRTQRLGEAWELGVQGYYGAALEILAQLLSVNALDTGSLRLKGNLLELKELDRLEYSAKKLITSADYLAARTCYEKILEVDPQNAKAHIDLGDHYRNLDANDKALGCYREAMNVLRQRRHDEWVQDVQELGKAVALLKAHDRLATEASAIVEWCRQEAGSSI